MSARRARALTATGITVTLAVALCAYLGYTFGRGQSLAEVARLYRDQNLRHYTLDSGALVVDFSLMGGDLKPLLRLPDGTSLVDFSDWDYSSAVIVDGRRFEMVRLIPTATVDYERSRIVAGLSGGDWLLSRKIILNGSEAEIRFTFLAQTPIRDVRITIAHSNWYYLQVTPRPDGFTATVPRATRSEIELGLVREPSYRLNLVSAPLGPGTVGPVRVGLTTPYGIQSVLTEYIVRNPPVGEYVPFAVERVTSSNIDATNP